MRAAVYHKYGDPNVLNIEDVPKPTPKADQVLVRVCSTTVSAGAIIARRGSHPDFTYFTPLIRLMFGILSPRQPITGYEFSGIIEAVGHDVTNYNIGDRVFGTTTGLKSGSYAEYICVPTKRQRGVMAMLPESLSFDEGAALPVGGMTAFDLLSRTALSKGADVLVYGASGSVGTYMLQYAKAKGATVTAVCSSQNHDMARSLGADYVLDYRSSEYIDCKDTFDVIADAVGKMKKGDKKRLLKTNGSIISISSPTKETLIGLKTMADLVSEGRMTVFIDKIYDLEDIQDAHAYGETGHKKGNLIIRLSRRK